MFKSTWEDSSHCNTISPFRYIYFRSASLDVIACTWVSQSGVRGTVGVVEGSMFVEDGNIRVREEVSHFLFEA